MKKILLLLTLTVITSAAFSQNTRACGQTLLDEAIKKDPSILENIKKNREKNQKWIELNKFNNKESHDNYPLIPGFTPTGDPKIDKINFQSAKAKLTNEDIQAYKKATRKENSKESIEKRKQMIAKQNQEPKK